MGHAHTRRISRAFLSSGSRQAPETCKRQGFPGACLIVDLDIHSNKLYLCPARGIYVIWGWRGIWGGGQARADFGPATRAIGHGELRTVGTAGR